jgi:flagellar basal body P-ring protein FlgI
MSSLLTRRCVHVVFRRRANQNLLWMYEEHCLDKDYVGFCRFNHAVDDKLYFDLARKGGKHDEHLAILGKALDAEGGTRLYAALNKCVNMILTSGNSYDSWIIALTDGESAWDFPAKQVISRIAKHNKQGGPQINVVIIGFEVPSQVAESVATITSITNKSLYIDARGGLDEMDNAFEQVAAVITGTAITMETF